LLLGVSLSDATEEFCGNLLVWPGSHSLLHKCTTNDNGALDNQKILNLCRTHRFSDFSDARSLTHNNSYENKIDYDLDKTHNNEPLLPSLGYPLQLPTNIGDIVMLHPDLAHAGGPNYSTEIRKMVYFRLRIKSAC
jgi:ectoine hydroxylase-related dioxygenase (phytanoyl-CoA dioxygenase family)